MGGQSGIGIRVMEPLSLQTRQLDKVTQQEVTAEISDGFFQPKLLCISTQLQLASVKRKERFDLP